MIKKKPLHPYEQSLLLVTLLFSRTQVEEILQFFPKSQQQRMKAAKDRFLRFDHGERMTQIIFELKRLLSIKEYKVDWIHPSWIEHELQKEAPYIQEIIERALLPDCDNASDKKIPDKIVMDNFLAPFLQMPRKVAIFDPVLIRLQALSCEQQQAILSSVGQNIFYNFLRASPNQRIIEFIKRHSRVANISVPSNVEPKKIFTNKLFAKQLTKTIITFKHSLTEIKIEMALYVMACYLTLQKKHWHKIIQHTLKRHWGLKLQQYILSLKKIDANIWEGAEIDDILLEALEGLAN